MLKSTLNLLCYIYFFFFIFLLLFYILILFQFDQDYTEFKGQIESLQNALQNFLDSWFQKNLSVS